MGGRRRRRRKHMKTCSLRAKTSVLKWTPEPAAAALLALSASAPHTHTWTHTCIHEGVERVVVEGKKKKKENICKISFSLRTGPPPSSSPPAGPHFILQFSSMLSSHDDNTRLVVSRTLVIAHCLHPGLSTQFFFSPFRPHFGHPLTNYSRFSGSPGLFTKAVN